MKLSPIDVRSILQAALHFAERLTATMVTDINPIGFHLSSCSCPWQIPSLIALLPYKSYIRANVYRLGSRSRRIHLCHLNLLPRRDWRKVLWSKLKSGDGQAYIFLVGSLAFVRPTCTDFDAFGHHAEVRLGVRSFLRVGQIIDGDINADSAQSSLVTSINFLGRISDDKQHSPFDVARSPVSQACL
jgi:hypothetical protein